MIKVHFNCLVMHNNIMKINCPAGIPPTASLFVVELNPGFVT